MKVTKRPILSILIPTYNRVSSLEKYSFPALAKLTYKNFELIVVNDGSKDDTANFRKNCQANMENIARAVD